MHLVPSERVTSAISFSMSRIAIDVQAASRAFSARRTVAPRRTDLNIADQRHARWSRLALTIFVNVISEKSLIIRENIECVNSLLKFNLYFLAHLEEDE